MKMQNKEETYVSFLAKGKTFVRKKD